MPTEPAGTVWQKDDERFALRLISLETSGGLGQAVAEQWRQIGIEVTLERLPAELYWQALHNREFDVALVALSVTQEPDLYDIWSQEAVVSGHNYGGWNHRQASEALENARQSWDAELRGEAYNLFQYYFQRELPAITLFQHTHTYALSSAVQNAGIGTYYTPRDRYASFPMWYLHSESVPLPCP